jgi:hypothetical protein
MTQRTAAALWWLGLSLYLGGMVALGIIVAPTLFAGLRELHAPLPGWPNAADGPDQLGGELFGRFLLRFQWVEMLCIALMALAVVVSGWKLIRSNALGWAQRGLLVAVGLLFVYDASFLTPAVFAARTQWRQTVYQHAGDPGNTIVTGLDPSILAHVVRFDQLHQRAKLVGQLKVWTLAALVIVSACGMAAVPDKKVPTVQQYSAGPP